MSIFGWILATLCAAILGLLVLVGIEQLRVTAANTRADSLQLAMKEAQQEANALQQRWKVQADAKDAETQKVRDEQAAQFKGLSARVGQLADGSCMGDADVERLLGDIARAANAAGYAGVDLSGGDPVPATSGAKGTH